MILFSIPGDPPTGKETGTVCGLSARMLIGCGNKDPFDYAPGADVTAPQYGRALRKKAHLVNKLKARAARTLVHTLIAACVEPTVITERKAVLQRSDADYLSPADSAAPVAAVPGRSQQAKRPRARISWSATLSPPSNGAGDAAAAATEATPGTPRPALPTH